MSGLRVVTVKSSGGDYSSLNAAVVGEAADLVALNRQLRIDCSAFADTTPTAVGSYTTDATHFITIKAVFNHGGAWNATAYTLTSTAFEAMSVNASFTVIDGLQVGTSDSSGQPAWKHSNSAFTDILVKNSIARISAANGQGFQCNGSVVFQNCIAYTTGSPSTPHSAFNLAGTGPVCLNCTAVGSGWIFGAFLASSSTAVAKNCLSQAGASTAFAFTFDASSTNNVASDSTAPGTNARLSQTASFRSTVSGSEDYHLAAGDTAARGYGTSLYGDATHPFSEDIDLATRVGTWDVGADQYVAPTTWTLNDLAPIPVADTFASPATAFSQRSDFAPLGVLLEAAATGTTFTDSVTESRTAADSQTGTAAFAGTRAESGTAAETETATAAFVGTRAESGTAAETETATATFVVSTAESGTVADTETGLATFIGTDAESGTASDASTGAWATSGSVAESGTAAESQSGPATFAGTSNESRTVAETETAAATFLGTLDDVGTLAESESATATFVGTLPDTLTSAESVSALAGFVASLAETASAADSPTALAAFVADATETTAATDAQDGFAVVPVSLDETLAASDVAVATGDDEGLAMESVSVVDAADAIASLGADQADALTVAEDVTGGAELVVAVTESLSVADDATGTLAGEGTTYDVAVDEALTLADASDSAGALPSAAWLAAWRARRARASEFSTEPTPELEPMRHEVMASEALTLRDRTDVTTRTAANVADAVTLADASVAQAGVVADAAEALAVADRTTSAGAFVAAQEDALAPADAQMAQAESVGTSREVVAVIDALIASAAYAGATPDALVATDAQHCELIHAFTPEPWTPPANNDGALLAGVLRYLELV